MLAQHRAVNNAGLSLGMIGALLCLGLAGLVLLASMPGAVNVPVAETINDHASQGHAEASMIFERYENKDYKCMRVYRSTIKNRLLFRFTYAGVSLEGGMLTTTSGKPVTAYMRTSAGWEKVIIRDGFMLVLTSGKCERERG